MEETNEVPKKTILVAEDESALREILVDRLNDAGYNVLAAKNGEEALDIALHQKPDAILLDQLMPILAGTHVLKKIRETEWGKNVYVIMLTNVSDGTKSYIESSKMANNYLVKSNVSIDSVLEVLSDHLEGSGNHWEHTQLNNTDLPELKE